MTYGKSVIDNFQNGFENIHNVINYYRQELINLLMKTPLYVITSCILYYVVTNIQEYYYIIEQFTNTILFNIL